jgi:hypothetical protein
MSTVVTRDFEVLRIDDQVVILNPPAFGERLSPADAHTLVDAIVNADEMGPCAEEKPATAPPQTATSENDAAFTCLGMGPCCLCEAPEAVAIWFVEKQGQGQGWGCAQCGLPPRGAVIVLCDRCSTERENDEAFTWRDVPRYCDGKERRPIAELLDAPDFGHDLRQHPELIECLPVR